MSDTPRTDALLKQAYDSEPFVDFARELERENTRLSAELAEARKSVVGEVIGAISKLDLSKSIKSDIYEAIRANTGEACDHVWSARQPSPNGQANAFCIKCGLEPNAR